MNNQRILVTGSSGLIGTALSAVLRARGTSIVCLDCKARDDAWGDVRDRKCLQEIIEGVDGIVHLAAVSRVLWGERNPVLCQETNVGGLRNVIEIACECTPAPWLIFASSREVYGQPEKLPVSEDCPLQPINVYGRSKVEGERLINEALHADIRACIIRLSNVYGSTLDHVDRVIPAFASASALGGELRVDGIDHTFDFTHVDDVTRGIIALVERLAAGELPLPPIHFVSGKATTLGELADLAIQFGQPGTCMRQANPRDFDVARFIGNPERAHKLLGWQPQIQLEDGLARLIQDFYKVHRTTHMQGAAPS